MDFSKLLSLASLLASERGATVQEILASPEFGYNSRSSIYADFGNISKNFRMDVEPTNEKRGETNREVVQRIDRRSWDKFRSAFIQKVLSDQDRLLLSFMLESIGSLSSLVSAADDSFLSNLQNLVGSMTISPTGSKGYFKLSDAKNLIALLDAQAKKDFLYIRYKGEKKVLWPLKCFAACGGIYCYVMNESGKVYALSVPRIEGIEKKLMGQKRERPIPLLDVEKALSDPFGIVRGDEEFTAVIKFSGWQGSYEKEKSWPDTVRIEKIDDGYLFTVTTCGGYWLKRWVMSLGTDAELLEPEFLRDEIKAELAEMLSCYQK